MTVIIVTLAVLMLFPVGAWALSFTNVAIIDPGGVNRAKVNGFGQLSVTATGSVTATQTPPNASYSNVATALQAGGCHPVTPTVPAGKALVVTSITVEVASVTTGPVGVVAGSATAACGSLKEANQIGVAGAGMTQIMSFPSGYPVNPGRVIGVIIDSTSGDAFTVVTVNGYLVSSTLCTVTGPPIGCN
ncbi:MAG TPA: hypothetical protein VIK54_16810 [Acidimicrobiia bacterium]